MRTREECEYLSWEAQQLCRELINWQTLQMQGILYLATINARASNECVIWNATIPLQI